MRDRQLIRDVIQRVYADATQTVLDDRAAGEILTALRQAGWADLNTVAAIIDAAGGEVVVDQGAMLDDWTVTRQDSADRFGSVYLRARRRTAVEATS